MAAKLDPYKEHAAEYVTPREPVIVKTEPGRYLTIAGSGAPADEAFASAMSALYGAAYTLKMASKKAGRDYRLAPLEGLWWIPAGGKDYAGVPASQWQWKLLIRVPDFVRPDDLREVAEMLVAKGKDPMVRQVQVETIDEGVCVQVLHVGSYQSEPATVQAMENVARAQGRSFAGPHHEIYLSDPRRVPPERLRTILRHPVA